MQQTILRCLFAGAADGITLTVRRCSRRYYVDYPQVQQTVLRWLSAGAADGFTFTVRSLVQQTVLRLLSAGAADGIISLLPAEAHEDKE